MSPGEVQSEERQEQPERWFEDRIRILMVDDKPDNLMSLEATLHGLADELVMANSGADALRRVLENDDFAAILLDVKMPDMDGFETAEMIRSRRRNQHTPILFLTGYRSDDQLFRGYDLGAVDFLFKPIVPEILRSKVAVFVQLARNAQLLRRQAGILAKAELKFRSLLEATPDATLITKDDGEIVLVNSKTQELFGYDKAALLGKNLRTIVPRWLFGSPDDEEPARVPYQASRDLYGVRRDGSVFPVETSVSPLMTEEGLLITSVIRDITERRRAEEKILRLNAQLEQRVAERTAELVRSNEALREFAWAASHDLQEPLRMVISFTELLERRCLDLNDEARQFLDIVRNSGLRMNALLAGLREYMQATEAGQHERQEIDCGAALKQALLNLSDAIAGANAVITTEPLPTVSGSEVLLVQLFQNLVGNAVKYRGSEPPRVHVRAERNGHSWIISVEDNGIGIAPEYHERIFGVFKRLHRDTYPGTGIGLAICKTVVEHLGGRIWVESELGQGAAFRFTVPAAGGVDE
jgi:PAS domain S-box-containing protein